MLTEKSIHKIGRIDQIVRDYFKNNSSIKEVPAKDLMYLFVEKGIFSKDYSRPGLPIRNLLRQLDAEHKLAMLKHCRVVRHPVNRNWYFQNHFLENDYK
jgi:hypothetical protein